jgi:hypothetical protein
MAAGRALVDGGLQAAGEGRRPGRWGSGTTRREGDRDRVTMLPEALEPVVDASVSGAGLWSRAGASIGARQVSVGGWLRRPDETRAHGCSGRVDDDDLHARSEPWRSACAESARPLIPRADARSGGPSPVEFVAMKQTALCRCRARHNAGGTQATSPITPLGTRRSRASSSSRGELCRARPDANSGVRRIRRVDRRGGRGDVRECRRVAKGLRCAA